MANSITHFSDSETPSPVNSPSFSRHHSISSDTSIPIIVIAVIAIFAAAFLLVCYYVFAVKWGLDLSSRINVLSRFSLSRTRRRVGDTPSPITVGAKRGLSEAAIRSIPIIQSDGNPGECAVCLSEFREEERLRIMPRCAHRFHIDCIDVWLQNNANCPFCRREISDTVITVHDYNFVESHEHYVVIAEIGSRHLPMNEPSCRIQESSNPGELGMTVQSKNIEQKINGDVRRCLSMNSADDRRELSQGRSENDEEISSESEDYHKSRRIKRSFLSLGSGKSGRGSAVQPLDLVS